MGFWATVLAALRFRSGQPPATVTPAHIFRVRVDAKVIDRRQLYADRTMQVTADVRSTFETRLEAN